MNNLITPKPSQMQKQPIIPNAYKLRDAAAYLSISSVSLRRLIARGLITPNRALRHLIIPIPELDRFLGNRE
jgi:hypothetical protein